MISIIRLALPEGSASLRTKYLLESDTGSTATPGWASTGHMANSSPAELGNIYDPQFQAQFLTINVETLLDLWYIIIAC